MLTYGTDPLEALVIARVARARRVRTPMCGRWRERGPPPRSTRGHERGLEVNVWTVNDPAEIARLADAGVDGIITDVPDAALQALGR